MNRTKKTIDKKAKRKRGYEIAERCLDTLNAAAAELNTMMTRDDEPSSESAFIGLYFTTAQARDFLKKEYADILKEEARSDMIDAENTKRWEGIA